MRLNDAHRRGLITEEELQHYIDMGYRLTDNIEITSGRPGMVVGISYMELDSSHQWTVNNGETQFGLIGSKQDLTNAGDIVNNGELMLLYTTGKIVNTGTIVNTGLLTLKELT